MHCFLNFDGGYTDSYSFLGSYGEYFEIDFFYDFDFGFIQTGLRGARGQPLQAGSRYNPVSDFDLETFGHEGHDGSVLHDSHRWEGKGDLEAQLELDFRRGKSP